MINMNMRTGKKKIFGWNRIYDHQCDKALKKLLRLGRMIEIS